MGSPYDQPLASHLNSITVPNETLSQYGVNQAYTRVDSTTASPGSVTDLSGQPSQSLQPGYSNPEVSGNSGQSYLPTPAGNGAIQNTGNGNTEVQNGSGQPPASAGQSELPQASSGGSELPGPNQDAPSRSWVGAGVEGALGAWALSKPVTNLITRGSESYLSAGGNFNLGTSLVGEGSWLQRHQPNLAKELGRAETPLNKFGGQDGIVGKGAQWWQDHLVRPAAPAEGAEGPATPPAADTTGAGEVPHPTTPPAGAETEAGEIPLAGHATTPPPAAEPAGAGEAPIPGAPSAAGLGTEADGAAGTARGADGVLGKWLTGDNAEAAEKVQNFVKSDGVMTGLKGFGAAAAIAGGTAIADKITPGSDGYNLAFPGVYAAIAMPGSFQSKALVAGGSLLGGKLINAIAPASDHSDIANFMRPGLPDTALMTGALFMPLNPEGKLAAVGAAYGLGRMGKMNDWESGLTSLGVGGVTYMKTHNAALSIGVAGASFLGSRVMHWL